MDPWAFKWDATSIDPFLLPGGPAVLSVLPPRIVGELPTDELSRGEDEVRRALRCWESFAWYSASGFCVEESGAEVDVDMDMVREWDEGWMRD